MIRVLGKNNKDPTNRVPWVWISSRGKGEWCWAAKSGSWETRWGIWCLYLIGRGLHSIQNCPNPLTPPTPQWWLLPHWAQGFCLLCLSLRRWEQRASVPERFPLLWRAGPWSSQVPAKCGKCSLSVPAAAPRGPSAAPVHNCEGFFNMFFPFLSPFCARTPPPLHVWDSWTLSHPRSTRLLPPAGHLFAGLCPRGLSAVWRVPFLCLLSVLNRAVSEVRRSECFSTQIQLVLRISGYLFIMALAAEVYFPQRSFLEIFGNIYLVSLVWCEGSFNVVFWIPSLHLLKERLSF